ncbi:MAG: shikimate dehydrogenase [Deltaproteobacteria bacterium]|jgi:shikimate dehydrogenase|nr:shikimate dehydrogenase [Deltaproteobacteria bacterium]
MAALEQKSPSYARPILLGLLGDERVFNSPSPAMHEAALEHIKQRGWYIPLHADSKDLGEILESLHKLGFRGLNVTAPLKEEVITHLAHLTDEAKKIGAVNTLTRISVGFSGSNTDVPGFQKAYLENLGPGRALVLGAGGAARAVIVALKYRKLTTVISARDPKKAEKLALEFSLQTVPWQEISQPFEVIINTTSASSLESLDPPPTDLILRAPKGHRARVIDINYGRPHNYFKQLAKDYDAHFFNGLPMLAQQAHESFAQWLGRFDIPLDPFILNVKKLPSTRPFKDAFSPLRPQEDKDA